jgi:hypothetical protein
MEQAFNYTNIPLDHEKVWADLSSRSFAGMPGGINLQILAGHESGLIEWADSTFASEATVVLASILATIRGDGQYGPMLRGPIDIDNMDNVCRAAYHMGLPFDGGLPTRLVRCLHAVRDGLLVFDRAARSDMVASTATAGL